MTPKATRVVSCNECPCFVDCCVPCCVLGKFEMDPHDNNYVVHPKCPLREQSLTLHVGHETKKEPQQGMVKVRIAVVVHETGHWNSVGWYSGGEENTDKERMDLAEEMLEGNRYWVEALLKAPPPADTVQGKVTEEPNE